MFVCTLCAFTVPLAGVVGDGVMVEVEVLVGAMGITLKVWKEVGVGNRSLPGPATVLPFPLLFVRDEGYLMPSLESGTSRGMSSGDDAAESGCESAIFALTVLV